MGAASCSALRSERRPRRPHSECVPTRASASARTASPRSEPACCMRASYVDRPPRSAPTTPRSQRGGHRASARSWGEGRGCAADLGSQFEFEQCGGDRPHCDRVKRRRAALASPGNRAHELDLGDHARRHRVPSIQLDAQGLRRRLLDRHLTSADGSAYSTPVGSATLAALLLQRARAGVCHRSRRAADLAKHLVQVAARGHGTTLRDQSSNRGRQSIGARSISGHRPTVARDGRHDQGSGAAWDRNDRVDRRRLIPTPGSAPDGEAKLNSACDLPGARGCR